MAYRCCKTGDGGGSSHIFCNLCLVRGDLTNYCFLNARKAVTNMFFVEWSAVAAEKNHTKSMIS